MWKAASALIGMVLVLVAVGIVMLASTSGVRAAGELGSAEYFVVRQLTWIGFAFVVGVVFARLDYHLWRRLAVPLALFTLALLIMVLLPDVGLRIKGSRRWLSLGPFRMQPSEVAKFTVVVLLAWWMRQARRHSGEWVRGLLIPGSILGVFTLLVLMAPDFGTTILMAFVGAAVMCLGGTRISHLVVSGTAAFSLLVLAILKDPVRMNRLLAYRDPAAYAREEGYQLMQALYAFVVGGPWGAGFGQSIQKHYYLPEAHTDFIFAIIGEELGFPGSLGVLLLYIGILACGTLIAARAPDPFGRLLAFGFTLMITVQAAINVGVVTASIPTTGMALPFISYGGSSLLMSAAMVGVIVNVALHAGGHIQDEDTRAIKDRSPRW